MMIAMQSNQIASARRAAKVSMAMPLTRRSEIALPSVTTDELQPLYQIGTTHRFARNEQIFCEGDTAEYAYKVVSGAVRLCKLMPDGRRQIADFFLPGDFFGIDGLRTHAFDAEVAVDVTLVRHSRQRIERLGDEQPAVRRRMLAMVFASLCAAQQHLVMLGRLTVKERIAAFLLDMATRSGLETSDGDCLELPVGRQDIADYLGLTIETVCRSLSDLKRRRIIAIPGDASRILLLDTEALHIFVEGDC